MLLSVKYSLLENHPIHIRSSTPQVYFIISMCFFLFQTLKAFLPAMMSKNHGHVITIASGAGLFGIAGLVDYCASKFGAVGIHEALTSELASPKYSGVHTTCVCPYFISTGMFDGVKTR